MKSRSPASQKKKYLKQRLRLWMKTWLKSSKKPKNQSHLKKIRKMRTNKAPMKRQARSPLPLEIKNLRNHLHPRRKKDQLNKAKRKKLRKRTKRRKSRESS